MANLKNILIIIAIISSLEAGKRPKGAKAAKATLTTITQTDCSDDSQIPQALLELDTKNPFILRHEILGCTETVFEENSQVLRTISAKVGEVTCNLFMVTTANGKFSSQNMIKRSTSGALDGCKSAVENNETTQTGSLEEYTESKIDFVSKFMNLKVSDQSKIDAVAARKERKREEYENSKDHNAENAKEQLIKNIEAKAERAKIMAERQAVIDELEAKENLRKAIEAKAERAEILKQKEAVFAELNAKFETDKANKLEIDSQKVEPVMDFSEEEAAVDFKPLFDDVMTELPKQGKLTGAMTKTCDKQMFTELYAKLSVANLVQGIFVSEQNIVSCSTQLVAGTILRAVLSFNGNKCFLKVLRSLPYTKLHDKIYHVNAPRHAKDTYAYVHEETSEEPELPNCADTLRTDYARMQMMHFE